MKISLFCDNVTVLDYAYLDDHLGVVGNSLHVDVEFVGTTDEEGVLYDFSYAKKKVKEIIDRDCDHRLVLPHNLTQAKDGQKRLEFSYGPREDKVFYEAPDEAFCEIPSSKVSFGAMQAYLENQIMQEMPKTVLNVELTLREEELEEGKAIFHYTHGLKDHYGNCQRLFHGHRNSVDVWINGERREDCERFFATDSFASNVHFCYWENVVNKQEILDLNQGAIPPGKVEVPYVEIEYESSQGKFWGKIPGREVYLMETESTVENLSLLFAQTLKMKAKNCDLVQVRAYEGIAKGAIATL